MLTQATLGEAELPVLTDVTWPHGEMLLSPCVYQDVFTEWLHPDAEHWEQIYKSACVYFVSRPGLQNTCVCIRVGPLNVKFEVCVIAMQCGWQGGECAEPTGVRRPFTILSRYVRALLPPPILIFLQLPLARP